MKKLLTGFSVLLLIMTVVVGCTNNVASTRIQVLGVDKLEYDTIVLTLSSSKGTKEFKIGAGRDSIDVSLAPDTWKVSAVAYNKQVPVAAGNGTFSIGVGTDKINITMYSLIRKVEFKLDIPGIEFDRTEIEMISGNRVKKSEFNGKAGNVELEPGKYTVKAKTYRSDSVLAEGSAEFTVNVDDIAVEIPMTLKTGKLTLNVVVPEGLVYNGVRIRYEQGELVYTDNLENGVGQISRDLAIGKWIVTAEAYDAEGVYAIAKSDVLMDTNPIEQTMNLEKIAERAFINLTFPEGESVSYNKVVLEGSSAGNTINKTYYGNFTSVSFPMLYGTWNLDVKAYFDDVLVAESASEIEVVKDGNNAFAMVWKPIKVNVSIEYTVPEKMTYDKAYVTFEGYKTIKYDLAEIVSMAIPAGIWKVRVIADRDNVCIMQSPEKTVKVTGDSMNLKFDLEAITRKYVMTVNLPDGVAADSVEAVYTCGPLKHEVSGVPGKLSVDLEIGKWTAVYTAYKGNDVVARNSVDFTILNYDYYNTITLIAEKRNIDVEVVVPAGIEYNTIKTVFTMGNFKYEKTGESFTLPLEVGLWNARTELSRGNEIVAVDTLDFKVGSSDTSIIIKPVELSSSSRCSFTVPVGYVYDRAEIKYICNGNIISDTIIGYGTKEKVTELAEGIWNVEVKLIGENGIVVGSGSSNVTVVKGKEVAVDVPIEILCGRLNVTYILESGLDADEVTLTLSKGGESYSKKFASGSKSLEIVLPEGVWELNIVAILKGENVASVSDTADIKVNAVVKYNADFKKTIDYSYEAFMKRAAALKFFPTDVDYRNMSKEDETSWLDAMGQPVVNPGGGEITFVSKEIMKDGIFKVVGKYSITSDTETLDSCISLIQNPKSGRWTVDVDNQVLHGHGIVDPLPEEVQSSDFPYPHEKHLTYLANTTQDMSGMSFDQNQGIMEALIQERCYLFDNMNEARDYVYGLNNAPWKFIENHENHWDWESSTIEKSIEINIVPYIEFGDVYMVEIIHVDAKVNPAIYFVRDFNKCYGNVASMPMNIKYYDMTEAEQVQFKQGIDDMMQTKCTVEVVKGKSFVLTIPEQLPMKIKQTPEGWSFVE